MLNCHNLRLTTAIALLLVTSLLGCGRNRLPTVPIEGKVLLQGKPLGFGGVVFLPNVGPPARGRIQTDGTFRLTTYRENDGAVLGAHRVQITCYESQRPGYRAPESTDDTGPSPGDSLIPAHYAQTDTSGLRIEVKATNSPFVFDLTN